MKKLILLLPILLAGCATVGNTVQENYLLQDPALKDAAVALVQDYLNGQMQGDSYQAASPKYGNGVEVFNSVEEYSLESIDLESGVPCVNVRIKATNGFWIRM